MKTNAVLLDNDGMRLGNEQRIFSYTDYSPERRSGEELRLALKIDYKIMKVGIRFIFL